jgi:hypothetical protein
MPRLLDTGGRVDEGFDDSKRLVGRDNRIQGEYLAIDETVMVGIYITISLFVFGLVTLVRKTGV